MSDVSGSLKIDIVQTEKTFKTVFDPDVVKQRLLNIWAVLDVHVRGTTADQVSIDILHLDANFSSPPKPPTA